MFEYWKTVYFLVGNGCHHNDIYNDDNEKLLDVLWNKVASKLPLNQFPGQSWTTSREPEQFKTQAYATRDVETNIWTFTDKFFKELEDGSN